MVLSGQCFDIIEVVGLLDYFSDERAVRLLTDARKILNEEGCMIVANVTLNSEVPFVRKTGWPEMNYRSVAELRAILEADGLWKRISVTVEPLGVHLIAIAQL